MLGGGCEWRLSDRIRSAWHRFGRTGVPRQLSRGFQKGTRCLSAKFRDRRRSLSLHARRSSLRGGREVRFRRTPRMTDLPTVRWCRTRSAEDFLRCRRWEVLWGTERFPAWEREGLGGCFRSHRFVGSLGVRFPEARGSGRSWRLIG